VRGAQSTLPRLPGDGYRCAQRSMQQQHRALGIGVSAGRDGGNVGRGHDRVACGGLPVVGNPVARRGE
jgi:hypothetical protein